MKDTLIDGEIVTVKGATYSVPGMGFGMWRYRLSNGRTIWLRMGEDFVLALDTELLFQWLNTEQFVVYIPVGETAYPYQFQLGRWAI